MYNKLLFILGCIPTRLLLSIILLKIDPKYLPYMSIILSCIGIGFLYLYITDSRLNAPEANGTTWWNNFRPIHGVMYLLSAIYAFKKQNIMASLILFIDTIIGTILFINKRLI